MALEKNDILSPEPFFVYIFKKLWHNKFVISYYAKCEICIVGIQIINRLADRSKSDGSDKKSIFGRSGI